jgi:hypothetical protein
MRSGSMLIHSKPFNSMTSPKLKSPTYDVNAEEPKGSAALSPFVDRISGFYNRKNSGQFQKKIEYQLDPYERAEDIKKAEYVNDCNKIISDKRYNTIVK